MKVTNTLQQHSKEKTSKKLWRYDG